MTLALRGKFRRERPKETSRVTIIDIVVTDIYSDNWWLCSVCWVFQWNK